MRLDDCPLQCRNDSAVEVLATALRWMLVQAGALGLDSDGIAVIAEAIGVEPNRLRCLLEVTR